MAKAFFRIFGRLHTFMYRLTSGRFGARVQGLRVVLVTTQGRRTGRLRTVPLGTFRDGEAYIITASNAGQKNHPGWFLNLRKEPRVRLEDGAESIEVRARVVEGDERARLWARLISLSPGYAMYERRTKRVIPMVALHAVEPQPGP
jgi:deazaflavin-dependent oxidoreductase (nitroreductase family)